jgi:hypothetical protein
MRRSSMCAAILGLVALVGQAVAEPLFPEAQLGEPQPVLRAPQFNGPSQYSGPSRGLPQRTSSQYSGPSLFAPRAQAPAPALEPIPAGPAYSPDAVIVPQPGSYPAGAPVVAEPWLAQPVPYAVAAVPLHTKVKYKQTRNIHPCSQELVVAIKDPCADKCCPDQCLYVKICVPPCEAPCRVLCRRDGSTMRYDWGKYAVDVTARRNGIVYVDYDD